MAELFCPRCGTRRPADDDLYCRHCGSRYTNLGSVSSLTSQSEEHPPIATTSTLEPTEVEGGITAATNHTNELKTNWLDFWIYVRLPLTVLAGIPVMFKAASPESLFGTIIVEIPLACLAVVLFIGLRKRRLSAWQLNFLWIFLDVLGFAGERVTASAGDKLATFVGAFAVYSVIWGAPNYVYFKKRRVLFTGEPLVEDGLSGLLQAVGRFIWPSVTQEKLARKASRQGLYAVAIILVLQILLLAFAAFGHPLSGVQSADLVADSLELVLYAAIGWGIYKMSRVASILGVLLYLAERIMLWENQGGPSAWELAFLVPLVLMFVNAVRGTIAHRRHQIVASKVAGTPTVSSRTSWGFYSAALTSFVFGVLALRVYQLLTGPAPVVQNNVVEEDLPALVKRVQPAVVTITTYDSKGNAIGLGSGFFVSKDGEILTNHHVLVGAASAEAKMSDGSKDRIDAVLADDPDSDLTKVIVIEDDKTPFLQLAQEPAEVGERIAVIGSPFGLEHTVSEGIVSAIPEERQEVGEAMPATLQITAPISEGSSGSPVIDMKGNVLGVATAYFQKGQDLNFAIPLERILILKRIKPVTLAIWSSPHRKPTVVDLFGEGLASMQLHDYEQALLSFDLAIRKKPDFAVAWWGAGVCLVVRKETDEGIEALKKASQLDPSLAQPHYSLGITYAQQGRRGPAYNEYETLKRLDPGLAKELKEQLPK